MLFRSNDGIPEGSRAARDNMAWIQDNITEEKIQVVRELETVAKDLGLTTAQLAIAWLLRRKEVSSVITGATKLKQLEENLAAADAVDKLDDAVLEQIEQVLDNMPGDE